MSCHWTINRGTPKRYRVVCKCCKDFALNTLSGTKTEDFNPYEARQASLPLLVWESPPPGSISRFGVNSFVPRSFRHLAYSVVESIHHSPANFCWRSRISYQLNRVPKDWRHVLAILGLWYHNFVFSFVRSGFHTGFLLTHGHSVRVSLQCVSGTFNSTAWPTGTAWHSVKLFGEQLVVG